MNRIVAGVLVLAVLLVGVAYFAATESYVLVLKARVQEPPEVLTKTVDKEPIDSKTADEIIGKSGIPVYGKCKKGETDPIRAKVRTCTYWVIRINVENRFEGGGYLEDKKTGRHDIPNDHSMDEVFVEDAFPQELGVIVLSAPKGSYFLLDQVGKHKPETRLSWCVTGGLDKNGTACASGGRQFLSGEKATMEVLIFTRLHERGLKYSKYDWRRASYQEYRKICSKKDPCVLNPGAEAEWVDKSGHQCEPLKKCPHTDPIYVQVVSRLRQVHLNSDIDFGTVYPGQVVQDHYELFLSDAFLDPSNQESVATYALDVQGPDPDSPGDFSIIDYIDIVREPAEGPEDSDDPSGATLTRDTDNSDLWWVIFTAPPCDVFPDPAACEDGGVPVSAKIEILVMDPADLEPLPP